MSTQKYRKLAGKHILIIGGTSGLGYAVAEASIESGARVTISSSSATRVQSTIDKLRKSYPTAQVNGYECDLATSTVETNIKHLFEQTGTLDHVVSTAGEPLKLIPLQSATLESFIAAGQVRFFAPLLIAKVGSAYLNPGPQSSIVLTTGSVGQRPMPDWTILAAYTSGLHGMTRNLALDLKPLRVNLVSPGTVDSELWDFLGNEGKRGKFGELAGKWPTGRVGRVEDVAEAYLWLMKDSNITGFVASSDSGLQLV